jgi:hypothetical protein
MGTNRGGGVVDGVARRRLQAILVPGWNPNLDANLFFTNFCTNSYKRSYTNYSTNSYTVWFLYQFIQFFIWILYSTNSYNEPRMAKPEPRGQSPSTPPAPTRPHPAAPTLGYTRLPRPLGYTRLPRPVRVRSWGTTSQRSSTAYFAGTKNISHHEGIL